MKTHWCLLGLVLFIAASAQSRTRFPAPPLHQPVTDLANIIDQEDEERLNGALSQLWKQGGSQIAVLTLPNLNQIPIEQASIDIVEQWQLGTKEKDNGVLFLVARDDRVMRIEVGQGLEGDLPDAYSKRIINNVVTPFFKEGRYSTGIVAGVLSIGKRTDPKVSLVNYFEDQGQRFASPSRVPKSMSWLEIIFWLVAIFFLLGTRVGRSILFLMLLTGGRGGGGFGGSHRGGFGGGGGGFSGGGASGRW